MVMETKKVDSQGRVSLPPEWRRENLGENREVIIQQDENNLIIKPKIQPDLTAFFDSIIVNIPPESFKDPHSLRKALIEAVE